MLRSQKPSGQRPVSGQKRDCLSALCSSTIKPERSLFALGKIEISSGVSSALCWGEIADLMNRHSTGHWGVVDSNQKAENEQAIGIGNERIFSHHICGENRVIIVTYYDHSKTSVFLENESD